MTDSRRLLRFALVGAVLGALWYVLYYHFVLPNGRFDQTLSRFIAYLCTGALNALGFTAARASGTATITLQGIPAVIVGWQCDGAPLYALFAIFIIAYPGPWRVKAWFIPAGTVAIFLANLVRVMALALNQHYSRETMEFNHHYTFLLMVYGLIFWLWTIWVRRYGTPLGGSNDSNPGSASPDPAAPFAPLSTTTDGR